MYRRSGCAKACSIVTLMLQPRTKTRCSPRRWRWDTGWAGSEITGAAIDILDEPALPGRDRELRRLRLATCLLGDIAWNAHPDFRAERAVDMACMEIGLGSIPTAGQCLAALCAERSAVTAGSALKSLRC